MSIKAITFDAGGTLIYPSKPVGEIYAGVALRMGITLDAVGLDESFKKVFKSVAPVNVNGTPLTSSSKEWWRNLVRTVLITSAQFAPFDQGDIFDEYFSMVYGEFLKKEHWTVCPGILDILMLCRDKGVKTAVLSNWDERLKPILKVLELEPLFDQLIISCDVGVEKPDPVIFQFASVELCLNPGDILHIGDSRREDYEGAINAGMKAFLIDNNRGNIPQIKAMLGF